MIYDDENYESWLKNTTKIGSYQLKFHPIVSINDFILDICILWNDQVLINSNGFKEKIADSGILTWMKTVCGGPNVACMPNYDWADNFFWILSTAWKHWICVKLCVSYIMELRYSPVCKSSLSIPMAAQVPTTKVPKNAGFCCSSNGMANCLKQNLTSTCWSQLLLMVIYRCIWCTLQVGDHEIQNDTAAWMQISGR